MGFDETQYVPRALVITAIITIAYGSGSQTFSVHGVLSVSAIFYGAPTPKEIPNTSAY